MRKHKKLIIGLTPLIVLSLVLILHFVPFDSRTGFLDRGGANICIGYTQPVNYTYRWITGGVNAWDDQLSYLKSINTGCAQPAHIKLYIL
jgi:hypothetical protein